MSEPPTNKELKQWGRGVAFGLTVGAIIIGLPIGIRLGNWAGEKIAEDLRTQAVDRGYAEWRLTHAHNGSTEFRWLDKPVSQKPPADHETQNP